MRIFRRFAVGMLAVVAGAIAQTGTAPASGTVHIYRLQVSFGTAVHPTVSCDTYPIAKLQNGHVYTITVPTGTHVFTTVDGPTGVSIHVESGKEYFVRIDYPVNSHLALHAFPVLVPTDQGIGEIRKLKPLDKWFVETAACTAN